jgi:hypothetical protein
VNRLTRRDQVDGDIVAVIFDSFHDQRTAFLFGASSSGVKFDQVFTEDGQREDASWDPNWWVKTSINSEGWISEMKIPFSQVRFEKNSGDVWGLQFARILFRKNETDFWQHIPKDAPGFVHLMGELTGFENIKPRKIFDITPYGVARAETFQAEPGNPFLQKGSLAKLNGGVDAKIGVTNNLTMDLTINPDFGQVEADPSEVNLSAYETFFPEKRPFFIEGKNITNYAIGIGDGDVGNDNLFYSRRIGRTPQIYPSLDNDTWHAKLPSNTAILGAAKLTGKTQKGLSVGFIEAMTAEERAEIDTVGGREFKTVEPFTNYMVGRVQKDFKEGNTIIGGILTSTNRMLDASLADELHKNAWSGGFDFTQYFNKKNWMFNLNSAFSLVEGTRKAIESTQESSARYFQRPDKNYALLDTTRTSLAGSGGRMQIMKMNGHWNFMSATLWRSPGFETNDLGYIRQADEILSVLWASYHVWDPKGIYRNYNINGDIVGVWNFGGKILAKVLEWNANMNFKNFWSAWTGGNLQASGLSTDMLRGGPAMKVPGNLSLRLGFSSDNRKKLQFSLFSNYNLGFLKSSHSIYTQLDITYKPTDYLSLILSPGLNNSYTDLQYVSSLTYNGNDRFIFGSIDRKTVNTSFRVNLNLSPNLTLQYWGQPFIATGKYHDYKYITSPMAEKYHDRFRVYAPQQLSYDETDNVFRADENSDGTYDYDFEKNDFNFQQFLSNLVIRWEYNPGSSVYLVWSQNRTNENKSGMLDLFNDLGDLFLTDGHKPHNVFLIKFSYRFGLK